MFATLTGPWPRVTVDGDTIELLEREVAAGRRDSGELQAALDGLAGSLLSLQSDAGLELVSDGQVRVADLGLWAAVQLGLIADPGAGAAGTIAGGAIALDSPVSEAAREPRGTAPLFLDWWRWAAARTDHPVKQAIPGPYTLGRRLVPVRPTGGVEQAARERITLALADALAGELADLAAAGCPVVEVEEPAAVEIDADEAERELFREAQSRLLARVAEGGLHATLAITGGSPAAAGSATILAAPYASFLFDLIAGPQSWELVVAAPRERGIVCGALDPSASSDHGPEVLVWAARYAASTRSRGMARVGLANASSLVGLSPERAAEKVRALGRAARFASMPLEQAVEAGLDARSLDLRSAALGGVRPRPPRRPGPGARRDPQAEPRSGKRPDPTQPGPRPEPPRPAKDPDQRSEGTKTS
jgi:hypothetical protein